LPPITFNVNDPVSYALPTGTTMVGRICKVGDLGFHCVQFDPPLGCLRIHEGHLSRIADSSAVPQCTQECTLGC
jgi:hypothetical protein